MEYLIVVLLLCLVIYFFSLHVLAKEDLIFVRKNITLEALFNVSFSVLLVGLFLSRVVYVALNFEIGYLNPLVFFLFPYYPGLSFVGGVGGGIVFLYLLGRKRKFPTGRIFDFFALSLLAALPLGFLGTHLLLGMNDLFSGLLMPVIFLATVIFFAKILLPLNVRGEVKDGSLGSLVLTLISFTLFLANILNVKGNVKQSLNLENALYIIIFLGCLIFVFFKEREKKGRISR